MVLVPAHAARGGLRLQGVRFDEGRARALDRAYRVRGPDHAAARGAAREHRNPHAGVCLPPVMPGRAQGATPESITPALAGPAPRISRTGREYGFRTRRHPSRL